MSTEFWSLALAVVVRLLWELVCDLMSEWEEEAREPGAPQEENWDCPNLAWLGGLPRAVPTPTLEL